MFRARHHTARAERPEGRTAAAGVAGLVLLAAGFGLAGGLIEGLTFWVLQNTALLGWSRRFLPIDANILWATPLFNALLFTTLALVASPIVRRVPWIEPHVVAAGLFLALAVYGIVAVPARLGTMETAIFCLGAGVAGARVVRRSPRWRTIAARSVPILGGVVAVLFVCVLGGRWVEERMQASRLPAPPAGAPNVLLIVLDTLRADRLGLYGYGRPTSPFLDSLGRQSVVFEKAFANSSWTLPSHASMFTGRLPWQHGATMWDYDGRFPVLAAEFAARGYATAGLVANGWACTEAAGLSRGFAWWRNIFVNPIDAARRTLYGRTLYKYVVTKALRISREPGQMRAEDINRRALEWLDARPDRPFFLFLNYVDTHEPYGPPREFAERFSSTPEEISPTGGIRPGPWFKRKASGNMAQNLRDAYDASVAYLDAELEDLFEELRRRSLTENLLVVVTSDHGESLGEHDLWGHRNALYVDQIRVPLIVRFPGRVPVNLRVAQPVGLEMLPATLTELARFERQPFSSPSLTACWTDGRCGAGEVISELSGGSFPGVARNSPIYQGWVKSLITDRWHLIFQENGRIELFDWEADAEERSNLAETPEGRRMVEDLGARLRRAVQDGQLRAEAQ